MELIKIPEKQCFVRKASLADFLKSIGNVKPTVMHVFLEMYTQFLEKYGHADQLEYGKQTAPPKKNDYMSFYA